MFHLCWLWKDRQTDWGIISLSSQMIYIWNISSHSRKKLFKISCVVSSTDFYTLYRGMLCPVEIQPRIYPELSIWHPPKACKDLVIFVPEIAKTGLGFGGENRKQGNKVQGKKLFVIKPIHAPVRSIRDYQHGKTLFLINLFLILFIQLAVTWKVLDWWLNCNLFSCMREYE